MRANLLLVTGFLMSTACVPFGVEQASMNAQLTPFSTSTPIYIQNEIATATTQKSPTPAPTATPLVHTVALGETISSIALRYGLDMGAVLAANPDLNPNMLIVGTEVIIPIGNSSAQIGSVSEPLKLEVGPTACTATFEGGLWCITEVNNPLNQSAAAVTVLIVLTDAGGGEPEQMNVPLLLDKIESGETIPAIAYFEPPSPKEFSASASLISALPVPESGRNFFPATVVNDQVALNGETAQVSGEVEIGGERGMTAILHVAAMAYDASGQLVGVRSTESEITLEPGNAEDFNLNLYSFGDAITSVKILAEAYQNNQ
jgi:LysM repeat protein